MEEEQREEMSAFFMFVLLLLPPKQMPICLSHLSTVLRHVLIDVTDVIASNMS